MIKSYWTSLLQILLIQLDFDWLSHEPIKIHQASQSQLVKANYSQELVKSQSQLVEAPENEK